MREYSLYFSGSTEPDPKFPYAPSPSEMYEDFQRVLKDSGYTIRKCLISVKNKKAVVEVDGYKS